MESLPQRLVRLDKWLWAARLFKTRAFAKAAIEHGRVAYNGQRAKASRAVEIGAVLEIKLAEQNKVLVVRGLSDQRRCAGQAQGLYEETQESIVKRQEAGAQRMALKATISLQHQRKPTKKERRQWQQFQEKQLGEEE